jgi:ribosomal protein S18 acetylase RimI-like enzyme
MSSGPMAAGTTVSPMSAVVVSEATEVTFELVEAFARLIPQLSSSNPPPGEAELKAIVGSRASVLLIARDPDRDDEIVGSLTLALFRIPTGLRAWIEDVVVDGEARGRGVGEALSRFALERARQAGAKTVDLTSRPSREAANRLYQRIGFELRSTNVYRYEL